MRCWAEIDLTVIKDNIKQLHRSPNFMAVVKANGYGHGAIEISRASTESGANWLGVATIEEGIVLREAEIAAPILVLSEPYNDEGLTEYDLTPVVYTSQFIKQLPMGMNVHLKIDTGMHRVGCYPEEVPALMNLINQKELKLQGLMTHLAGTSSDDKQLAIFNSVIKDFKIGDKVIKHVANSAAVSAGIGHYDMDRCGIGMYGTSMQLKSRIGLIKKVSAGEGISYGGNYHLKEDGYIGIVPIGYADGVPRRLIGTKVLLNNGLKAIIASVTMDQMIIDLRGVVCSVGMEVNLLIHEWPNRLNSTPYENFCGISTRVPRIYV